MKALVTGIEGFVGPHLASFLSSQDYEVAGTYYAFEPAGKSLYHMDILDKTEVANVINEVKPDHIFHLAGFSSVAMSFTMPDECKSINVTGTRNLLDAIKLADIKCKILVVSSADVYGKPITLPIDEKHPLQPMSPYAESRAAQESECLNWPLNSKMQIVVSRSFNHSGPGQTEGFVLSSFAKQIAQIERGIQDNLKVGNLDAIRDFSDVRDVVRAYYLLMQKGKNKEIFNVCSGIGHSIKELLEMMVLNSSAQIDVEIDASRLRPSDIPVLIGDNKKLVSRTGWGPSIPIEKTLENLLDYWREKISI